MNFFIRFVQIHETFREPEIQALATLANINVEFLVHSEEVNFEIPSSHTLHLDIEA